MGGNISHEFQALSENGEDKIVFSKNTSYASNINTAKSMETINFFKEKNEIIQNKTKSKKSIKNFNELEKPLKNFIKTILVRTKVNNSSSLAALLIREEHELNLFKIEEIDIIEKPLSFVNEQETIALMGVKSKFLGPLGLKIPIFADVSVYYMKNFTIGSNINEKLFINVNWNVDLSMPIVKDIRNITKKDLSSDGSGNLEIKKSIEIGHIFQLGQEYSKKMNVLVQGKKNDQKHIHMGCYGIGITRIIAAIIEQNHDNNGIIWPDSIAPFQIVILPLNIKKCIKIKEITENLYKNLKKEKIDVILDDRNERPGIMFNEMDLIGIPHQIIISPRHINENKVEYRERKNKKSILIKLNEIICFFKKKFNLI